MFIKYLNLVILWCQWPITKTTRGLTPILTMSIETLTLTDTDSKESTDAGY